ncbi:hypothetical protein [Nostoc sp.]|uniref:hypothetical protein n=1 Tax=Nostoc sp. TaxID=1180 RepID=UPI002FFD3DBA
MHYRAGEACGVVGVQQSLWRRCDRLKKSDIFNNYSRRQPPKKRSPHYLLVQPDLKAMSTTGCAYAQYVGW